MRESRAEACARVQRERRKLTMASRLDMALGMGVGQQERTESVHSGNSKVMRTT